MEINIYCFPLVASGKKNMLLWRNAVFPCGPEPGRRTVIVVGFSGVRSPHLPRQSPAQQGGRRAYSCTRRKLSLFNGPLDACLFSLNSFILYMNTFWDLCAQH